MRADYNRRLSLKDQPVWGKLGGAMAVYSKDEVFSTLDEEVFGSTFLSHPLPKYRFPGGETDPDAAYQLVHDQLLVDGNSRQNLATFCQTWVEPQVRTL